MPSVFKKGSVPAGSTSVYVGRPTKWGNPFPMRSESERDSVISQFQDYLLSSPDLLKSVNSGVKIWCVSAHQEPVMLTFC